jgi:hypothetical protein
MCFWVNGALFMAQFEGTMFLPAASMRENRPGFRWAQPGYELNHTGRNRSYRNNRPRYTSSIQEPKKDFSLRSK